MDYSLTIWSLASHIEANIKNPIEHKDLEEISGFSYRHIRTIIKEKTGLTLSNYISTRRIAHAAFSIRHSKASLTDIAYKYGFSSYDAFARTFKTITGQSPKSFRQGNDRVGHRRILMGFYGPEIHMESNSPYYHPHFREDNEMNKKIEKSQDHCILYGVPKVAYSFEECTPLAVSIKAAMNYLGDPVDYGYVLAAMGAAFRLRWNKNYWDGGNVDVLNIYPNQYDIFKHTMDACGRNYKLLTRDQATKESFMTFIKEEIDQGRPVIALGIIGPPEACLVTGYMDQGQTLLGWNCFQENKEVASGVTFHECGYFQSSTWWDNPYTIALVSIGSKKDQPFNQKDLLAKAIHIMEENSIDVRDGKGKVRDTYACGQAAYDLWAESIQDESQFNPSDVTPLKIEKLMCQWDAQAMVGEGRSYAACFLETIGKDNPQVAEACTKSANHFRSAYKATMKMTELRGNCKQDVESLDNFMKAEVRQATAKEVYKAKDHEKAALLLMKDIYQNL